MPYTHGGNRGRRTSAPRRVLTTGLAALLTTAGALAVTASPAAARWVLPASVTYTDAGQPDVAFAAATDVPVGTWEADNVKTTARAYFTFDLTPYRGRQVISAQVMTGEGAVADCDKPRELELWRTDPPAATLTWNSAPVVREKIGDLGSTAPCPAGYLELAVTDAFRQAVADGRDSLTLMARIRGDHEESKHYGRRLSTFGVSLLANAAPDVPGKLSVEGLPCADGQAIGTATPPLSAEVTDPDAGPASAEPVAATFAWWPVDRPTERTESTSPEKAAPTVFTYRFPDGSLVDGGTYAFAVRASDAYASSDWSAECRFTVDVSSPAQPTVSSTDYPADEGWYGGVGIPGRFTFTANDAADTVGFQYWLLGGPTTYVALDTPGGSATVTVAPDHAVETLSVQAVDRAGNRSPLTSYVFRANDTSPTVTAANPTAGYGEPRTLTFSPGMENVVEYTYRLNSGPEQTVAAAADGTAVVTITSTQVGSNAVYVRSRTADGLTSGEEVYGFTISNRPTVTSVEYPMGKTGAPAGTPGTFVFGPGMPGVTEYVYSFDGRPAQTVAAGADGSASVSYTPTTAGLHRVTVYSRTGDGFVSQIFSSLFFAAQAA
ncbi:DNRLRE domain-containing protein [Micromonospora sp. B11E3]|uniref:DNRLRE domain-containing protein n=1 Tax=Micromonospora sp. B11E3 TaxID=3153562 RepID=UPI00325D7F58